MFNAEISVFSAFAQLSISFVQGTYEKRKGVLKNMRNLECGQNVCDIINKFKCLLTQFTSLDGQRDCPEVVDSFMENLPNRFNTDKRTFESRGNDDAFTHCWKIVKHDEMYSTNAAFQSPSTHSKTSYTKL